MLFHFDFTLAGLTRAQADELLGLVMQYVEQLGAQMAGPGFTAVDDTGQILPLPEVRDGQEG